MASTTAINSPFSTNTTNCVRKITHFRRATLIVSLASGKPH
uniref:Uncharacterized protein n=1 Tax=Nelumbo nucifera TaxID=4432 RepID=A0A822ZED9_NELNU|nr:TPA_asm: hypothetical protein HUJ06_001163 [Nelumbo nucifera]